MESADRVKERTFYKSIQIEHVSIAIADYLNYASVIEFALKNTVRNGKGEMNDEMFDEAYEIFNSGETKKWESSMLEITVRHVAGHTLMCLEAGKKPSYITITASGYVQHGDNEGKALYTKAELLGKIRTSLGGRTA